MPHVIVKMLSGRSGQQKARLAEQITKAVVACANCAESAVSVRIEDVKPGDWVEKVYKRDILNGQGKMFKEPGYDPL